MESIRLIVSHTVLAGVAAICFFAGGALAIPVQRRRIESLMEFPKWFAQRLLRVIEKNYPVPVLGLFIFSFNGCAIFVYMLTGVIPGATLIIAAGTGMNVALAGLIMRSQSKRPTAHPPLSVRAAVVLTFCLELPCFWYSMALGLKLPNLWLLLHGKGLGQLLPRVDAYFQVILPTLLLSAMVEAYAVSWSHRHSQKVGTQY